MEETYKCHEEDAEEDGRHEQHEPHARRVRVRFWFSDGRMHGEDFLIFLSAIVVE